jgi:magnesium transporter
VIRAWIADAQGVRETAPGEALEAAQEGTANAWVDFESESEPSIRAVLGLLDIHPLVIDDIAVDLNRPKVDDFGTYLYVAVHSARWDDDRPVMHEIDMVLGARFLITSHDETTRSVAAAREVIERRPSLLQRNPAVLLHHILDDMVDNYLPIVDHISEELDELEERVLGEGDPLVVQQKILHLKRGLSALRRIVGPQRDILLALTRDEFSVIPAELRPYLRDVYDRLARVTDLFDSFRDETGSLLDLHVSTVSNRLNVIIKRLTVLATVGLPLTIITSYYGMNFALPEYHWPHPELLVMGLMAASALVTWAALKWTRWM